MAYYETGIIQGDPTSIIVSNAYTFGARDFDQDLALTFMRMGPNNLPNGHLEITGGSKDKIV